MDHRVAGPPRPGRAVTGVAGAEIRNEFEKRARAIQEQGSGKAGVPRQCVFPDPWPE
ncbi:MAG: hypothetical protein AB1758_32325 [Candidatus Eremiobacterota bacterium]